MFTEVNQSQVREVSVEVGLTSLFSLHPEACELFPPSREDLILPSSLTSEFSLGRVSEPLCHALLFIPHSQSLWIWGPYLEPEQGPLP